MDRVNGVRTGGGAAAAAVMIGVGERAAGPERAGRRAGDGATPSRHRRSDMEEHAIDVVRSSRPAGYSICASSTASWPCVIAARCEPIDADIVALSGDRG